MFTISVCMIIKNEELVLKRILGCAKQFADEIIIVDTGSIDTSIDIAKKYTDKVYNYTWCNDFSKARNFAFSKATKDYIMWLDADDLITKDNISKINELKISNISADVFMFKYIMGFVNNSPTFEFYRERLLKREKNFIWQGFVHECITPSGDIKYLDIQIEHRKISTGNPKRNLGLYNYHKKNGHKFNAREQYYYSRELYYNGYFKKSITEFKKYLKMNDQYYPNIIGAYIIMCEMLLQLNQPQTAKKYIFDCLSKFTPNSEVCCMTARIFEKLNNIKNSIFWYNIAIISPKQSDGFIQKDYSDFIPYLELCRLHYSLNQKEEAKKFYTMAKELKPTHPSIIYNEQFFK